MKKMFKVWSMIFIGSVLFGCVMFRSEKPVTIDVNGMVSVDVAGMPMTTFVGHLQRSIEDSSLAEKYVIRMPWPEFWKLHGPDEKASASRELIDIQEHEVREPVLTLREKGSLEDLLSKIVARHHDDVVMNSVMLPLNRRAFYLVPNSFIYRTTKPMTIAEWNLATNRYPRLAHIDEMTQEEIDALPLFDSDWNPILMQPTNEVDHSSGVDLERVTDDPAVQPSGSRKRLNSDDLSGVEWTW